MQNVANLTNRGFSNEAKEILCRNAELRTNIDFQNKLLTLRGSEEVIRIFSPKRITQREVDDDVNADLKQKFCYKDIMQPNFKLATTYNDTSVTMTGTVCHC